MSVPLGQSLEGFRLDAHISMDDLFIRYFALGGTSTSFEMEAILHGALEPSDHDHDVIAHALNERFTDMGCNYPVPYRGV